MARLAWHPAFVQAIAIELEEYRDVLTFESEHQLTAEPLKIDVLIIKKKKNVEIKKNIGQLFRQFNVVEYKSPTDRATIESYHKTQCYARLYAALNKVSIDEMSVSVVATRHPRKLLTFLEQKYAVERVESGIYLVEGDTCSTQIIVSEELSAADNLWINNLRNDLTVAQLELFTQVPKPVLPLDAYVYVLGEANIKPMEEMIMQTKKGYFSSLILDDYFFGKGIAIGEARGEAKTILTVLRARFGKVPRETEKTIRSMTDSVALDSWAVQAATCTTMKECAEALK